MRETLLREAERVTVRVRAGWDNLSGTGDNRLAASCHKRYTMVARADVKPVEWVGSSLDDLRGFPKAVRATIGQALFDAQTGGKHPAAKPLKGFGGAGVVEIVEDDDGSTYRAVYTVRLAGVVYVLHAFQKKSKSGIRTPPADIATIRRRLKVAEQHYASTRSE